MASLSLLCPISLVKTIDVGLLMTFRTRTPFSDNLKSCPHINLMMVFHSKLAFYKNSKTFFDSPGMLMIYRLCANDILSNTCLGVTSCFYITFLLQITDSLKKQQRIRIAWRNIYIGTCWVVSLVFFYPDHYGRPPKSTFLIGKKM